MILRMRFNITMKTHHLLTLTALLVLPALASANERLFTYTYESGTLNPGDIEFEPWTTVLAGKASHFLRLDQRFEFEFGLTDALQMAWYVNLRGESKDTTDASGQALRAITTEFQGVSLALKYQLFDPVADALGLGIYTEVYLLPAETKFEGMLILDKAIGNLVLGTNLLAEYELAFEEPNSMEGKTELYFSAGATYRVTRRFALGLEARSLTEIPDGEGIETSVIHAGPVFSYNTAQWWVTGTFLPQVVAVAGPRAGTVDLEASTQIEARVLFGIHL